MIIKEYRAGFPALYSLEYILMKIQFCHINESYLLHLQQVEPKIMHPDSFYQDGSRKKFAIGV